MNAPAFKCIGFDAAGLMGNGVDAAGFTWSRLSLGLTSPGLASMHQASLVLAQVQQTFRVVAEYS